VREYGGVVALVFVIDVHRATGFAEIGVRGPQGVALRPRLRRPVGSRDEGAACTRLSKPSSRLERHCLALADDPALTAMLLQNGPYSGGQSHHQNRFLSIPESGAYGIRTALS
jgi:hypothetical protein